MFETRPELVQIGFYFFKFIALNLIFYHMFTEKRGKIQIDTCLCRKYKHALIHTVLYRFTRLGHYTTPESRSVVTYGSFTRREVIICEIMN